MATPVFKLTAQDVVDKINPTGMEGYFVVGSGHGEVPEATVDKELRQQEARVLSSIPEKYRRMVSRMEGLIVVRYATDGQTEFSVPLVPTGDIQVFHNYPGNFGHGMKCFGSKIYAARTAADATTDWVYEDGVVLLGEALSEGDHVLMDFNHDSMDLCLELSMCVVEQTASEVMRGYPTLSQNINDKVEGWEKNAHWFLRRLWNADNAYKTGIQFFDDLKFVGELETRSVGARRMELGFVM